MFVDRRPPRPKAAKAESSLYILELEGGNYYVGVTENLDHRLAQHFAGKGSVWTRLHRPTRLLHSLQVEHDLARLHERCVTAQMVLAYGAPCVRGAGANAVALSANGDRRERLSRYRLGERTVQESPSPPSSPEVSPK